jgi:uncharacterized protein (TIGR00369 family)
VSERVPAGNEDSFLRHIGLHVLSRDATTAVCEIEIRDDLRNRAGMLQGGVTATLVDVAGGVLAATVADNPVLVTQDLNMHYLAPARVGPVQATATLLRQGRRTVVCEVRVIDVGASHTLCAFATMTLTVLPPRP